jgi:hypothetical protein
MSLENHIDTLQRRHTLLDLQIIEMEKLPTACYVQLTDLKRRKLRLKETIERLSSQSVSVAEVPCDSEDPAHDKQSEVDQTLECLDLKELKEADFEPIGVIAQRLVDGVTTSK